MLYYIEDLLLKYKNYKNIYQKISLEVKKGNLFSIKRGLYSDNIDNDKYLIANQICSPSYISFETALAYYDLIPEKVVNVTCATYKKNKSKKYLVNNILYIYQDIKDIVFNEDYVLERDDYGRPFKIATPEKAICDKLSTIPQIKFIKGIKYILFEDLRIDKNEFDLLDHNKIKELAKLYNSVTLKTLIKYLEEEYE